MSNWKGEILNLSIFGQSHGPAIGMTLTGVPSGYRVNFDELQQFLNRRAPGNDPFSTSRKEADKPEFLSGLINENTCGTPISAVIRNTNTRSGDYANLLQCPRPGHADYTARIKYEGLEDTRGGGAFSGRMTAPICILGAIAKDFLSEKGITIGSHILSVAGISEDKFDPVNVSADDLKNASSKLFGTLSDEKGREMLSEITKARENGDSVGGVVECAAVGVPVGLGGELFDGIESELAQIVFSVPAVKGFELGAGFESAKLYGSTNNDPFYYDDAGNVKTETNNHGGVLGGITSGMPLIFRAAIKPTPSIAKKQKTVNLQTKENTEIVIGGRHDSCIVPRVLPVLESCLAITLLDKLIAKS